MQLITNIPRGLVVRIRRSHRRGPGSIPGVGKKGLRFMFYAFPFFLFFFFLIFGFYFAVSISHMCYCFICSTGITLSTSGNRINLNR